MCQSRFRLDVRKNFFMAGVVRHCNRLPGEMVESLPQSYLRNDWNVALKDVV